MRIKDKLRCGICNKVNTDEIATNLGDCPPQSLVFQKDPKDKSQFICIACYEVIKETNNDFENIYDQDNWMEGFKI